MYPFLKPGDRVIAKRVSPNILQVGDVAVAPSSTDHLVVHRLVKLLPEGRGIFKGDSLLQPDPEPVELSTISGRVEAIVRGERLIPISSGLRSRMRGLYALLSLNGLTIGALKLKAKNLLMRLFPGDESSDFGKERRFILGILCGHSPGVATDLDWMKIEEIAFEEGVVGILYRHLKDRDIPQSALSPLKEHYQSIAAQNLINLYTFGKLEDALCSEKIEIIALKGASLQDNLYPGVGMRPMGDLDLMVRPEEQERFVNLLERLGYKSNPLSPHFFNKGGVLIDLHIHALNIDRIANRAGLFPTGMEPVWANSVPWGEGYQWLRRPYNMDNILLLSLHLMKHSFSRLIWLVDIYELLRGQDNRFWTRLSKRADQLFQRRPLSYTLYLLKRLFGLEPPEGSGFEDLSKDLSRLERGILGAKLQGGSVDRSGPVLAVFCVRGFMNRIAFGWETLFPKKEIVKQEFTGSIGGRRTSFYPYRFCQMSVILLRHFSMILGSLIRGS